MRWQVPGLIPDDDLADETLDEDEEYENEMYEEELANLDE